MRKIPDVRTGTNAASNSGRLTTIPPIEMRSLEEILEYTNPKVIERYQIDHGLSKKDAKVLLKDVLLFLYVCATTDRTKEITPTHAVDEGWHGFIMFTREYQRFCKDYFGFVIHHEPFTLADKRNKRGAPMKVGAEIAQALLGTALSKNWETIQSPTAGDCTGGDCSGDCCPLFGD